MERPTDDLVQRILAAAAADAGGRAESLVKDARAEAEAEVKELLKTALKAALLRQALTELETAKHSPPASAPSPATEPAPTPTVAASASACYVYAITNTAWGTPPPSLGGLGHAPLRVVRHDDLQAVTSDVSLDEFGPGVIDERLKDLSWVEQKVRGHDAVVKALSAAGTVIPCRFCTILRDPEQALAALRRHHQAIHQTLERIDSKKEWGVKLLADTRATPSAASPSDEASTPDTGRAYLLQKKRQPPQREQRDELLRAAREAAEACHLELSALAADSALLPTRDRGGSRGWHLALNAAYLIPEPDTATFHARVDALAQQYRPHGLRIDLTGPWPPYNFAALDLSEAAT